MESQIYQIFFNMFVKCLSWTKQIIQTTGLETWYLAAVTVAMITGFLLSPLRNGVASGLDSGSDKAANAARARSSRPYRLGQNHKIR